MTVADMRRWLDELDAEDEIAISIPDDLKYYTPTGIHYCTDSASRSVALIWSKERKE